MAAPNCIVIEHSGSVARLSLSRPEARNALDLTMIRELDAAWSDLQSDPAVRIVILTGDGRSFCAGADRGWLRAVEEGRPEDWIAAYDVLDAMLQRFACFEKPVICHVTGTVVGAGAALAALSDLVLADEKARFILPELKLGMVPTVVVPHLLPRLGKAALRQLFLFETEFGADRARELGLVDQIVTAKKVEQTQARIVKTVLSAAPQAAREFKKMLRSMPVETLSEQAEFIRGLALAGVGSIEMIDGVKSAITGRMPHWSQS